MKQFIFISFFLISQISFSQVDNFDLLSKNIESSGIKSITKFIESNKFPNGEKKFKIEFDKQGKLVTIEEYEYPMGPNNPIIMRQDIKYDNDRKKIVTYIKAPDGSIAVDTFIYDIQGKLIQKLRLVNGKVVKTKNYSSDNKESSSKEFDSQGNLIKETESEGNFTQYKYDSQYNLIEEIKYEENQEHIKYTFEYDSNKRLNKIKTYLLYIDKDKDPLKYYFEYENFK